MTKVTWQVDNFNAFLAEFKVLKVYLEECKVQKSKLLSDQVECSGKQWNRKATEQKIRKFWSCRLANNENYHFLAEYQGFF